MTVMEELVQKYDDKARAFDSACDSLIRHDVFPGLTKEELKNIYLKKQSDKNGH